MIFPYLCIMITREKILQIQNKIKEAIAQIEKDENVKIDFGTLSFNPQKYSTSMTVSTLEKSEVRSCSHSPRKPPRVMPVSTSI